MIDWEYNPDDYTGNTYQLIPPGDYRVRIEDAVEGESKSSGKPMITLTLKVSGYNSKLWHYIVVDGSTSEAKARTNNNFGQIFDSFAIPIGNFNISSWIGKVGAARIKHRPDNREVGKMQASISFFITRSKQDELPAWQEKAVRSVVTEDNIINSEMADFGNDGPIPF